MNTNQHLLEELVAAADHLEAAIDLLPVTDDRRDRNDLVRLLAQLHDVGGRLRQAGER